MVASSILVSARERHDPRKGGMDTVNGSRAVAAHRGDVNAIANACSSRRYSGGSSGSSRGITTTHWAPGVADPATPRGDAWRKSRSYLAVSTVDAGLPLGGDCAGSGTGIPRSFMIWRRNAAVSG